MNKKIFALLLVVAMVAALAVGLTACKGKEEVEELQNEIHLPEYGEIPPGFKVGLICLHDENSTYDKNFIDAMKATQKKLGLSDEQVIIATGVGETEDCYNKACEFADNGCNIIFADSFGHEKFMLDAAKKYPKVQFCHATGTTAHTENLANFHNAFAAIYQGRFLAGVAAGMKLNEMIADGKFKADEAKMGYVGAWTYAEVISGLTSFYLGAKYVCPSVTMDVQFTGSWYDETMENNAAKLLIGNGCKLISQHADSMGAPNACEEAGIPNVSYNGSTLKACPDTFIISSRIDWSPYYEYAIGQIAKGEPIAHDWTGTIETGSVRLTNLGGNAMAKGTVEKIIELRKKLVDGDLHVFDASTFKVDGETLTKFMADVDSDAAFEHETNVMKTEDGVTWIDESGDEFRSAPYFDLTIDGITFLNKKL